MKSPLLHPLAALLLAAPLGLALGACSENVTAAVVVKPAGDAAPTHDEPAAPDEDGSALGATQLELLALAHRSASKFPLDPHVKNRSRAQERVVDACLQLGAPELALDYAEDIANWRRGKAFAAAALARVQRGVTDGVQGLLMEATKVTDQMARDADSQAWRRDEIRALVARTYHALGQPERAAPHEENLTDSEAGKLAGERAAFDAAEAFDDHVARLDAIVARGGFDAVRGALDAYVTLYDHSYADAERRALIEGRIRAAFATDQLPVLVQIETLQAMAEVAVEHGDDAEAVELVDETLGLLAEHRWLPEQQIQTTGALAELLARAGADERARQEAEIALAMYDETRERIVDIYRAETLVPLAEAFHALGDAGRAHAIWARAADEAVVNPNSRPRCDDLVEICVSLALAHAEPPEALMQRLHDIGDALGDPW